MAKRQGCSGGAVATLWIVAIWTSKRPSGGSDAGRGASQPASVRLILRNPR